jgi:hypothetical protein
MSVHITEAIVSFVQDLSLIARRPLINFVPGGELKKAWKHAPPFPLFSPTSLQNFSELCFRLLTHPTQFYISSLLQNLIAFAIQSPISNLRSLLCTLTSQFAPSPSRLPISSLAPTPLSFRSSRTQSPRSTVIRAKRKQIYQATT